MPVLIAWSITFALLFGVAAPLNAQTPPPASTVFQNVRIFDGTGSRLSGPSHVLVRGNRIERISSTLIASDRPRGHRPDRRRRAHADARAHRHALAHDDGAADGGADAHRRRWPPQPRGRGRGCRHADAGIHDHSRFGRSGVWAQARHRRWHRDGPRIYPSGATISVTSGHGDFRQPFEVPRVLGAPQSRGEQVGAAMIADSPDEVRVRVREQLMQGATQIKLTAGGGVASPHSPLDATTFTEANCAPPSKPPAIGGPTSPCMPTRQSRSSDRSPQG